jgi:uncharacterized protein YhfF
LARPEVNGTFSQSVPRCPASAVRLARTLGVTVNIPEHLRDFWSEFAATQASDPGPRFLEAFYFDDNEPSANELAALVLSGRKRATAGLLWSHEKESKPLARPGDLSIVTTYSGQPVCVIETRKVEIVPFDEVSAEFAATEGEGDGSLQFWRKAHEAFFGRECSRIGRVPEARMPVVCEEFEVVFPRTGR